MCFDYIYFLKDQIEALIPPQKKSHLERAMESSDFGHLILHHFA